MRFRQLKRSTLLWQKTVPYYDCHIGTAGLVARGARKFSWKKSFPRIEWFYIPASVGFGLICFIKFKHIWKREQKTNDPSAESWRFEFKTWQVELLKKIPTRTLSRIWGYCCAAHLPMSLRNPLIKSYAYLFDCNLDEALSSDPKDYSSLNKFFTRQLKAGVRNISQSATMVSPADSTVLSIGTVNTNDFQLEQVKGFSYPLRTFVGPSHPFYKTIHSSFNVKNLHVRGCPSQPMNADDDFNIFYCILYLGPGDYHGFHSPTEWTIEHRRHIPGHLFSVNPRALSAINGIFNFNERVLLSGHWKYGPFLYGAIGAYNVGSIKLNFPADKDLCTNDPFWNDKYKDRLYSTGSLLKRGEPVGWFELGSSLVLIFTAPKHFQFSVKPGEKLKYGQPLGSVDEKVD